jgi:hypothetical protein
MNSLLDSIPEIRVNPEAGGVGTAAMPSASKPKAAAVPFRTVGTASLGRRSFLRTAVVGGGALAVSMLGWVAERVPAFAAKGDRTTLHPNHCMNSNVAGDTPCWGRTYIGSQYCGTDGRHRTDSVNSGPYTTYYSWEAVCGGYAGWYWVNDSDVLHNCWDGNYYTRTNATGAKHGPYTSICKKRVRG